MVYCKVGIIIIYIDSVSIFNMNNNNINFVINCCSYFVNVDYLCGEFIMYLVLVLI